MLRHTLQWALTVLKTKIIIRERFDPETRLGVRLVGIEISVGHGNDQVSNLWNIYFFVTDIAAKYAQLFLNSKFYSGLSNICI